jgi:hypothetical protein
VSDYKRTPTMRSLTDDELVILKKNLEELKGMSIKARGEFIGVTEETIFNALGGGKLQLAKRLRLLEPKRWGT